MYGNTGSFTFPISYSSWNSYSLSWSTVANSKHDYTDIDEVNISFFRTGSSVVCNSSRSAAISILTIGY